jgi:nitrilase
VPAAFTHTTGMAHWEVLLRARAIENQCYVLASAQGGVHPNGRRTFGHSMLIDPWGTVKAVLPEGEGVVTGDIDAAFLAGQAREHGIWLIGGTLPLSSKDAGKVLNSTLVYDPQGQAVSRYDKIHLFGFQRGDESYDESRTIAAGSEVQTLETPFGRIGLSVCYDLRFPELYRALARAGAEILCVPAAFPFPTGAAHWEVLLRARAIENQCWVLAANQHGPSGLGHADYGHSMIIDPWGTVVACASDGERVVTAEIDLGLLAKVRREMPCLDHARLV